MEIWATPTHPLLRTYTNSSLASCILVQLSDLCNLGFAVHVQYGNHQYMLKACPLLGVCRGASHLPNSLIYKKSPPNCCLRAKEVWKIGNFMYFWTKKWLKIQGRVLFCQICALWGKKNSRIFAKCPHSENQEEIHFWQICTLLRRKSLVWAWLKPVKCIGLGSKGGLGSWAPSIFWVGVEVSCSPPKNPISLKI